MLLGEAAAPTLVYPPYETPRHAHQSQLEAMLINRTAAVAAARHVIARNVIPFRVLCRVVVVREEVVSEELSYGRRHSRLLEKINQLTLGEPTRLGREPVNFSSGGSWGNRGSAARQIESITLTLGHARASRAPVAIDH